MIKKTLVLAATAAVVIGFSAKSSAEGFAVVNLDKIKDNYTAAQELTADMNVKEAELKKFLDDAQKQIQNAKTPLEKQNLQDKLGEQFNIKRNAYSKDQAEKLAKIEDTVVKVVKEISSAKKFNLVLNKQVVIDGGCDITDDVLAKLNVKPKS